MSKYRRIARVEKLEDRNLLAIGQGFNLNAADVSFIADQIKIAEFHSDTVTFSNPCGTLIGTAASQIPVGANAELLPLGLRTIDGSCNNLVAGQEDFGAADRPFPRLTAPYYRDAENLTVDLDGPGPQNIGDPSSYAQLTGVVEDSEPRVISNLIADQTPSNPAAVAAAGPDMVPDTEHGDVLFIPNVAPDEGLSAPFNNTMVFFSQFFDHGLDLTTKTGSPVYMPLKPDDSLFDPEPDALNFMLISRAINESGVPINNTTPYVDQQQTYASHPSMHIFLREYENNAENLPVPTGRMLTNSPDTGMGTWTALKAQAASLLGIQLVDHDVSSVPLMATDPYGKFLPGENGYPQFALHNGELLEGDPTANGGLGVLVPANAISTGHAFLVDIAHHAVPGSWNHDSNPATPPILQTADLDTLTVDDHDPGTFDDEMLGAHYVAGDGRVNENIGLTAVHHVFHSEHNRLVEHIKEIVLSADATLLDEYQVSPGIWDGERLFQAARFVTEMEYQHLAFEEFARKVQPQVNVFDGYDATIDAAITAEFSQAAYRFGHSILPEVLARTHDGTSNTIDLFDAFLNPLAFDENDSLTADEAAGSLFQGLTHQIANALDPFISESVRNTLVGLPLDLAAINIARGRDYGLPPLNQTRRELFEMSPNTAVQPYESWMDFSFNLTVPESLVNYIAAYGTHPTITASTTVAAKRTAADALVTGSHSDSTDFMHSLGDFANIDGITTTGVDEIDLWIGGLGEQTQPFGGILGDTFNSIFELQMEMLQEGDRFYYLERTAGMNLLVQLEGNSFSEMIMRNTSATDLPADAFSVATYFFDAAVQGSQPMTPIVDDPNTPYDERTLLVRELAGTIRYPGGDHVNWAGNDSAIPGEGDRIRSGAGDDTLMGSGGDDRLEGGSGNDNIIGGLGDDIITDLFGDEDIKGGDGNDAISSGQGFDLLQGGRGMDFIIGSTDPKEILGGPGNDFIFDGDAGGDSHGDDGDDWIEGGRQGDGLEGDSGLVFLAGPDINTAGHDVLNGNEGNDQYFAEGGDDILISGTGQERFMGQFGFDWVTHYNDPQDADSDLLNNVFAPPLTVNDFDRFSGIEGLSGWSRDDALRGDDAGEIDLAGPLGSNHELNAAGITRIAGLASILPAETTSFRSGNILLGGGGSDTLEGRGGDDVIHGNAWLRAQLMAPDPQGEPGATQLVDSMIDLQADVFAGLINPGDISIVRSIESSDTGTDTAVYSGPLADYDLGVSNGTFTVDHARGDGLSNDAQLDNGTDLVTDVERLQFADQTIDLPTPQAPRSLMFSTLGNNALPNLAGAPDDADIYQWAGSGANYSRIEDASSMGLAGSADIDGLSVVTNGHFFATFNNPTVIPGLGTVQDEDVVLFENGAWSHHFDGSLHGLAGPAGFDLDAISVDGSTTYFSIVDNETLPGVAGTGDDADIYSWNGVSFAREFDASTVGLATTADVDAISFIAPNHFFLSFNSATTVPIWGLIQDEDVVSYNAGVWSLEFDGSNNGLSGSSGLDLDAISMSEGPDVTRPEWSSGNVTASNETESSFDLEWSGANDDIGVIAYNVYLDGNLAQTVASSSTTVEGLQSETTFAVTIQALDGAMNESVNGPSTFAATNGPDLTPPNWSGGVVTASNETASTIDLNWSGAQDNMGVTAYRVYVDGSLDQTVTGTSTTVSGLAPNTTIDVTIQATDEALNESIDGPSTSATTLAANVLTFSTLGNGKLQNLDGAADNADLYQWSESNVNFERPFDATAIGLSDKANVDGLSVVGNRHFFASFTASVEVPDIGTVEDEDVVEFNNGTWTLFFDGSHFGLGTAGGLDLDAISVDGSTLYFSTIGNTKLPGVDGQKDDSDVYSWSGSSFARVLDATEIGLPKATDLDGLTRIAPEHFFFSFNVPTSVPTLGRVEDKDVIEYNAGVWSVFFDALANGIGTRGSFDLDAISISVPLGNGGEIPANHDGTFPGARLLGDFNGDGRLNHIDVKLLSAGIQVSDLIFDLNEDHTLDQMDMDVMVEDILRTSYGDANLDGRFNSSDLVRIFQAGEWEDAVHGNSDWSEGDWNGDGDFDSADLVLAFTKNSFSS
ncbi:MAG: peroxidase family protein [Pirellulaceae bacterium]|nr:peroxidase family protein [Pirellulaceae bacterium]